MAEVAWYPYFDSRREATVKLLGQTENSAGARHFAGGVIEIRLGAISLSPHARASLPPRLSLQVVLFGKPVKRRELPAAELQAALQGTATGGGRTFLWFTLRAVHTRSRRTSCRSCRPRSARSSGQSERAGAGRGAALALPRSRRCSSRAWVDLAAMSTDLVDERRRPPADVKNRPPTTPSVRSCFPSSRRAAPPSASPSRSSKSPKSVRERSASRRSIGRANASPSRRARRPRAACARRRRGRRAGVAARSARSLGGSLRGGSTAGAGDGLGLGHLVRAGVTSGCDRASRRGVRRWRTRDGRVVRREGEPRLRARRPDVPGRPDVRRRGVSTAGLERQARAERAAADDAPVAEHADLAKLRPRRAVQELRDAPRDVGNHVKTARCGWVARAPAGAGDASGRDGGGARGAQPLQVYQTGKEGGRIRRRGAADLFAPSTIPPPPAARAPMRRRRAPST